MKTDDDSIQDSGSEVGWNSDNDAGFYSTKDREVDGDDEMNSNDDEFLLSDAIKVEENFNQMNEKQQRKNIERDEIGDISSGSEYSVDEENAVHERLMKAIDNFSNSNQIIQKNNKVQGLSVKNGDVSMAALIEALGDSKGLGLVKKRLAELEKGMATPKFTEKVVSNRLERKEAYDASKENMTKWQDVVTENRKASTLDLTQNKRHSRAYKSLINKFKPETAMEKEITMVLVKKHRSEAELEKMEEDALSSRQISMEEIREKQAELAKVKALMFYEQMKRHRLKKIKSKAYHTIRKRQRLKREKDLNLTLVGMDSTHEQDDVDSADKPDNQALKRVKERMDLRHKNTSKWAKMALQHGHSNKSLRDAYHESVRLGHELQKKVNEPIEGMKRNEPEMVENDWSESDNDGNPSSDEKHNSTTKKAFNKINKILHGNEGHDPTDVSEGYDGKYKKLFSMDFMKKAAENHREKARDEAKHILREIQEMEFQENSLDEKEDNEVITSHDTPKKLIERTPMNLLNKGFTLDLNHQKSLTISSGHEVDDHVVDVQDNRINLDIQNNPWLEEPLKKHRDSSKTNKVTNEMIKIGSTSTETQSSLAKERQSSMQMTMNNLDQIINKEDLEEAKMNTKNSAVISTKQTNSTAKSKSTKRNRVEFETKVDPKSVNDSASMVNISEDKQLADKPTNSKKLSLGINKSQTDLVNLAFSGLEYEEEFENLKKNEIDDELGLSEKRSKVLKDVKAGWGDWAGPGAMMISQKILKKRDELLTKIHTSHETRKMERKDFALPNVMISEKRIKVASKFKIPEVPHPFATREEYERSLQMPIGDHWNTTAIVKKHTMPEVKTRAGKVIQPINLNKF